MDDYLFFGIGCVLLAVAFAILVAIVYVVAFGHFPGQVLR